MSSLLEYATIDDFIDTYKKYNLKPTGRRFLNYDYDGKCKEACPVSIIYTQKFGIPNNISNTGKVNTIVEYFTNENLIYFRQFWHGVDNVTFDYETFKTPGWNKGRKVALALGLM